MWLVRAGGCFDVPTGGKPDLKRGGACLAGLECFHGPLRAAIVVIRQSVEHMVISQVMINQVIYLDPVQVVFAGELRAVKFVKIQYNTRWNYTSRSQLDYKHLKIEVKSAVKLELIAEPEIILTASTFRQDHGQAGSSR
jgi:hypothetical protein